MNASNYTLYQLIKYHIELSEALEYSLITYKYEEHELIERLLFLKAEYKKGFFHFITKKLFNDINYLTSELKDFLTSYNREIIEKITKDHNLNSRIKFNKKLYLAYSCTKQLIDIFLEEERIKKDAEKDLLELYNASNKHFNYFFLFNSLNMFIATKVNLLSDDTLYTLEEEDKQLFIALLTSIESEIEDSSLYKESLKLIKGKTKFKEDDAYELLNKVSMKCIEAEKDLYTEFEDFSLKLEKELEKKHN